MAGFEVLPSTAGNINELSTQTEASASIGEWEFLSENEKRPVLEAYHVIGDGYELAM